MTALQEGQQLEPQVYRVRRADLIRYAGASGDFNPIHWSDRVAVSVGLPGVLAHGMYTMALAARAVGAWSGPGARLAEMAVRFAKPVLVPDDDEGVDVQVAGTVAPSDDSGRCRLDLTVTSGGVKVLGMARAFVVAAPGNADA
ncbi:MAG: MaoC/PaaZ C-terminal domain-containing protein [Nocardioidaceae bacterium]